MHRNDHPSAPGGVHVPDDPQRGIPGTVVTPDLMNALQDEIANVVEAYLGPLDKADNTQLLQSIQRGFQVTVDEGDFVTHAELGNAAYRNVGTGNNEVAQGDHGHAELATKQELADHASAPDPHSQYALESQLGNAAYKNVGSGADQVAAGDHVHADLQGGSLPIGVPIPWPTYVPPDGYLMMSGQSFDLAQYPLLAQVYATGIIPDLRGEFIRGWDNGAGRDPDRQLLSWQADAIRNIAGTFAGYTVLANSNTSGPFTSNQGTTRGPTSVDNTSEGQNTTTFDASLVVPTAAENRPRNVSFLFICRAR